MGTLFEDSLKEKLEVQDEVQYKLNWDDWCELSEMENDIKELKKLGCTHITFNCISFSDFDSVKATPYIVREETDEEFAARKEKFRLRNLSQREKDLIQLKKLKEMYEQ